MDWIIVVAACVNTAVTLVQARSQRLLVRELRAAPRQATTSER
ncbi:hypothetical protein ACIBG8_30070 [Nonomuraea sp. NPDC050556]